MDWHIQRIKKNELIVAPNLTAEISFLRSDDAGRLLGELALQTEQLGPINFASIGTISIGNLFKLIEEKTGGKLNWQPSGGKKSSSPRALDGDWSPFGISETWTMNISQLQNLGLMIPQLLKWLPDLVQNRARIFD